MAFNIIGMNKTYYQTGDWVQPVCAETWSAQSDAMVDMVAKGSTGELLHFSGTYFDDAYITDDMPEDFYTVTSWWVSTQFFYLSKPADTVLTFYILKTPVSPILTTSVASKKVTLNWRTTSLACRYASVSWGDGSTNEYTDVTSATHTYADNGSYVVTVTLKNALNMIASPTTTYVVIGDPIVLKKHDTIYLLDEDTIIKPIHADYQLIFTDCTTQLTLNMPFDSDVVAGRNVYLYHKFAQIFTIESVTGDNRTINVTCVDYVTAVLNGRVVVTGTDQNEGYRVYSGKGGLVIPSIMSDNLFPSPRDAGSISCPTASNIGSEVSIRARYGKVSDMLEEALRASKLTLSNAVFSVNKLIIVCSLSEGAVKNVNLTTRRYCGELRTKTKIRLATTAFVAGDGEGAERETAWQGNTTSSGASRVEIFVDGGESTTTTELDTQEGNSLQWNLLPDAPYQIYTDFWIGDTIYVEGTAMVVTQIDLAKSKAGETIVLTLGYAVTGTDSTVVKMSNNVSKNYS